MPAVNARSARALMMACKGDNLQLGCLRLHDVRGPGSHRADHLDQTIRCLRCGSTRTARTTRRVTPGRRTGSVATTTTGRRGDIRILYYGMQYVPGRTKGCSSSGLRQWRTEEQQ